ncbi:MAG: type I DNA topoisomerase [Spirochaetales bacterium]|nr:type I DNA topoisomerase [Spirochaetales bacterium]MCF7938304.1 type I DNA topoisomerase [Spirochaetales bacterium]
MEKKTLVIVESPTKARTIKRFLPKDFEVQASVGHIRDLPQKASDVPEDYKQEDWARLGIDIENDFRPLYIIPKDKKKVVRELGKRIKESERVLLATDEDREGESIAWHLMDELDIASTGVEVGRLVFHEITKKAIEESLNTPRDINENLVEAQETRRILDRLFGYTISPLIWKKIAYGLSAGRVQSPGLRLIVDRERKRMAFRKSVYWDLKAQLSKADKEARSFEAVLERVDDKRIAAGKDFDPETGDLKDSVQEGGQVLFLDEKAADELKGRLEGAVWQVQSVQKKEQKVNPAPPFITSTLQQEGNRKLSLTARQTMRTAQRLYEEGFITYMRTDSPALSGEAIGAARREVEKLYGSDYLFERPRQYKSKSRGAQEAHEAIRPAGVNFRHPEETGLSGKELALYRMIWSRTLATQMKEAVKENNTVKISAGPAVFSASGSRILFPGFFRAYVEGKDDPEAALEDRERFLPELSEEEELKLNELNTAEHETKPPARFTEATLVRELEKLGIGRPSTYAGIINTLYERGYIRRDGSSLVPTFTGFAVTQLMERYFHHLIEYDFTSDMEDELDRIAEGEADRLSYLKEFYNGPNGLKQLIDKQESKISPEEARTIDIPHLSDMSEGELNINIGKFGPYLVYKENGEEETVNASIPEEIAPAELSRETIDEILHLRKNGPVPIGTHPETGEPIFVLTGRYGPYVQLGEVTDENPKPKRASLPKGTSAKEVDLELAVKLLSLPRKLGIHPESGKEITAGRGRFGPYVVCDGDFRSIPKTDDVFTIDLDRALELLNKPKKGRGGKKVLADLGKHPSNGKKIAVYDGRYGPYIKHGTKNISLPDDLKNPEDAAKISLEKAVEIIGENGSESKTKSSSKSKSGAEGKAKGAAKTKTPAKTKSSSKSKTKTDSA